MAYLSLSGRRFSDWNWDIHVLLRSICARLSNAQNKTSLAMRFYMQQFLSMIHMSYLRELDSFVRPML